MASIFKVIRDNDIQLLNYLIDSSTGDQHHNTYNNILKQDIQFIQQQLKNSGSKYYDLNRRSVNGRTALHCAVTWNRVEMAQALIDCPNVNINLRDRENGWTALHRALYMGNIEISRMLLAREDIDPSIKDWEGLDAYELYNSTISDTFPKEQIQYTKEDSESSYSNEREEQWQSYDSDHIDKAVKVGKGGTDVYTWGHNTNYVLGHADSENRVKPERVHLQLNSQQSPKIMLRPTCVIESVSMSKYHMAILTSESQQNLLVCGFGRGGRLGTGKEIDTQFTPVPVQWPERIVSVALGRDHTIAITGSGNVLTFGQNNFGQLGYEADNHNKEDSPMQLVPRKIQAQSLKKQPILGAAASRIHSVVYTATDIFTFGYNQGQLGYRQPDNEYCQIIPRKVSMSTSILQVVANDNATAILNSSHDIILLCNYNQQKLFLPVHRFPNDIQVHRSAANFPVKLLGSGTEYLGAVTTAGDVFMWTCRSPHVRQSEQQQQNTSRKLNSSNSSTNTNKQAQATIVSTPKRIWTVRKAHLAAVDASIGQHGEIIICTVSGHVFIGRPEANGYKFNIIPSIQRCLQVCANSSGAFAAIRSEYQLQPITDIPASTLVNDMITSLPHVEASNWLKKELERISITEVLDMTKLFNKYRRNQNSANIEEEDVEAYTNEKHVVKQKYDQIRMNRVHDAWERSYALANDDSTLDIILIVDGKSIYCHSSILRCRSEIFKRLVKCKDHIVGGDIKIKLNKRESDSRMEIYIQHCQLTSVLLLLDYVYTDVYQHPMSFHFELPILADTQPLNPSTAKSIQKDLLTLAKIFHIPNLMLSAQENFYRQSFTLQKDFKELLEKGKGVDVTIETKDGNTDTKCHEVILRQRCAFFGNILKAGSVWIQDRRKQAIQNTQDYSIKVNLDHIPKEIMDTIIRYIYVDEDGSSLFNEVEKDREEYMMDFLLSLLCEADALLLTRLKAITESALVRFIKLRSSSIIFEYADLYLADSLKKTCLQFISVNLPALLGSSMLDSIPIRLVRDLEKYVRQCQIQETSTVPRGESFNFSDDDSFLEVEDPEFSTSIFASTRGDGSISSFAETLVTLHSAKPFKNQETDDTASKKSKSPILIQETASSPTVSKTENNGKMKKGIKVSLDNLENELNLLQNQSRRSSSGWVAAATTELAESSSKPSLREIIETENQPLESASKGVKSSIPKKISQKERRRLIHKQELGTVAESSTSSTKPVWGKVSLVEAQPISKIIAESGNASEEPSTSNSNDKKGKKVYVPEELLDEYEDGISSPDAIATLKQDENSFNPNESIGSSFNMTPIRHLHISNSSTASADTKRSFQTIQQQQQLEDSWRKNLKPKKNIMKIQKEEQAIESIAQYYVQTLNIMSGEWYEVRRMATR